MKKAWVWIVVLVVIVVLGYLGRHAIKSMVAPAPTPTVAPTSTPVPTAMQNSLLMEKTDSAKGNYLTDPKGMTLYIFDKDTKGVSNCYNGCATLWPPYLASTTAPTGMTMPENVTEVKRTDGSMQYAYKGMPLYYYSPDKAPGDTKGDGVGGVWHLVKP